MKKKYKVGYSNDILYKNYEIKKYEKYIMHKFLNMNLKTYF